MNEVKELETFTLCIQILRKAQDDIKIKDFYFDITPFKKQFNFS